MVQQLWKTVWQFLRKLNIELLYDPAIPLLGIHPRGIKTYVHTKTCTQIVLIALLITTEKWKQLKCPSVDEQINKMWYIHRMEYFIWQ